MAQWVETPSLFYDVEYHTSSLMLLTEGLFNRPHGISQWLHEPYTYWRVQWSEKSMVRLRKAGTIDKWSALELICVYAPYFL